MAERALTRKKGLGSYYTDPRVVDFLVEWGMGVSPGLVMDPSCGDGRFPEAAARRGASRIIGCDLDPDALESSARTLCDAEMPSKLLDSDFFLLDPNRIGPVDLVVGNPPFIRYQQFSGKSRARALGSALRVGARLTNLSASWAPFLLHSLQFLRPGGALAMVVPAELAQTGYGVTTLRALCANFSRIRLVTFRRNWFADAQQEIFFLLAEGRGGSCVAAQLTPLDRMDELSQLVLRKRMDGIYHLSLDGDPTLGLAFLDSFTRDLWAELKSRPQALTLEALGGVINGYVSGANTFFHCTREEAVKRRSYGGGVLKLEPTEMQRIPVILPTSTEEELRDHFDAADRAIRAGDFSAANQIANRVILEDQLGLSVADLGILQQAHATLLDRRMARARSNAS